MNYLIEQWRQDKLRCALAVCWLLTVAASFFNDSLFPITIPGIGTWYAFRTMLPLTAPGTGYLLDISPVVQPLLRYVLFLPAAAAVPQQGVAEANVGDMLYHVGCRYASGHL